MLSTLALTILITSAARTETVSLKPPAFPNPGEVATVRLPVPARLDWKEAIVSWSVKNGESAGLEVAARLLIDGRESKAFRLGSWSLDPGFMPRTSVKDQSDEDADVDTDILIAKRPGKLELELTLRTKADGAVPRFEGLWVSLSGDRPKPPTFGETSVPKRHRAWGKVIDVPQRAQMNYPNGSVLCSPTSVSMMLAHWAKQGAGNPDHDVPVVAAGVFDPAWNGTGNWPFNTAFAASQPGIQAFVKRLEGIEQIEEMIDAGFPVVTSVAYGLLKGKPQRDPGDGHLVVVVGFTQDGDPVFNDPGRGVVRQVYGRDDFLRAWASSQNTVYVIAPSTSKLPLKLRQV